MRLTVIAAVISAILASFALIAAPAAFADGDPASDVLVDRAYFQPVDLALPAATEAQLQGVLAASAHAGFPIRVAMIASQSDLGTATPLWNEPGKYVEYLGAELSFAFKGQVLVVMPDGFGLYGPRSGPHAVTAAESAVRAPAPAAGPRLATSAIAAVPLLAAAAGHTIPAAALAAAERSASVGERVAPRGATLSPTELLALVLGALLIAVAWWASLRARPLQLRRGL
ncbi:MAG: hypothetical protein FWD04_05500 [Conexibacteraceae bacterium]|nr:hypothetical protein [Conexibacteraceae bacterium]